MFPTPPAADYPSAHANAGGAGAEVIKEFFDLGRSGTSHQELYEPLTIQTSSHIIRVNSRNRSPENDNPHRCGKENSLLLLTGKGE